MQKICLFVVCIISMLSVSAKPPQEVRTGYYLMNLYNMNMDEHSFYADFYIWFKWKGSIDPTNIEYVNMIEKWSINTAGFDGDTTPVTLKDGTKYKILRVEGRFFHPFSLNRFPLDEHQLDIQIENPEYPADSLVYLPDTANAAAMRETLRFVTWESVGCKLTSTIHDYKNNFGNPQENAQKYSNLTFSIGLARPINFFLLKMLLPIAIVILVSIGALILNPLHIDTRSSLPIGGLLTAVFLQQSYNSTLPDTGSMVLMDKIYLLGYLIISLVLLQILRAGNVLAKDEPMLPLLKQERRLALLYTLIFGFGVVLLCLW